VPDVVRERLDRQLTPYRRRFSRARWLLPEGWHVTLLFLGSVARDRVAGLIELVDAGAARRAPFAVALDGGGGHRSRRGSVAWISVRDGAGTVIALADELEAHCPDGITLGAPPRRTPSAHVTVARRVDDDLITALHLSSLGLIGVSWTAHSMALYRSVLSARGSTYETVHEAALYARAGHETADG
jgi:2'-5' RNA ligase